MLQLKTQFPLVVQYWFKGKEMSALNIKQGTSSQSAYDLRSSHSNNIETHTLAVVVDNEASLSTTTAKVCVSILLLCDERKSYAD